jgi:hypothetical protein
VITYAEAINIAEEIGYDCVAHVRKFKNLGGYVPIITFKDPSCKRAPEAVGPSDGTPLVVATLTTQTPTTTSTTPTRPTTPTPLPLLSGQFAVMNATGGIYWRSSPDWNAAEISPGTGVFPGTVIKVSCFEVGKADVPGTTDDMWEQASWISGSGSGSGWINEHFINDGSALDKPSPGAPFSTTPSARADLAGNRRQRRSYVDELHKRRRHRRPYRCERSNRYDRLQAHRLRSRERKHLVVPDRAKSLERFVLRFS